MDDRIVDFNELKNKARDKDIEKFEQYIYGMYYSMAEGKLSMSDFTSNIKKYMDENNISQEKFFNIQREIMKRYGLDFGDIEAQMKNFGIDIGGTNIQQGYEDLRKNLSFQEKYKGKIKNKNISIYSIKNSLNNVEIILEEDNVILKSTTHINLQDVELNEFLCSYKKVIKDKTLNISICENIGNYQY